MQMCFLPEHLNFYLSNSFKTSSNSLPSGETAVFCFSFSFLFFFNEVKQSKNVYTESLPVHKVPLKDGGQIQM